MSLQAFTHAVWMGACIRVRLHHVVVASARADAGSQQRTKISPGKTVDNTVHLRESGVKAHVTR